MTIQTFAVIRDGIWVAVPRVQRDDGAPHLGARLPGQLLLQAGRQYQGPDSSGSGNGHSAGRQTCELEGFLGQS